MLLYFHLDQKGERIREIIKDDFLVWRWEDFDEAEFKAEARLMGMTGYQVPVEAYWLIGCAERVYSPLRRAYKIIKVEMLKR